MKWQAASRVATVPVCADLVAEQQRAGARRGGDGGRDIGTVVFLMRVEDLLEATPEARAERRSKEHSKKANGVERGKSTRKFTNATNEHERRVSPLVRAADLLVDNTAMESRRPRVSLFS